MMLTFSNKKKSNPFNKFQQTELNVSSDVITRTEQRN